MHLEIQNKKVWRIHQNMGKCFGEIQGGLINYYLENHAKGYTTLDIETKKPWARGWQDILERTQEDPKMIKVWNRAQKSLPGSNGDLGIYKILR